MAERLRVSRQEQLFRTKFETLELFVRVIAHELNGPLTGMNLTLQALRQKIRGGTEQKLLSSLEKDLAAATALLEELKSLNRYEIFRMRQIDLGQEFHQFAEQLLATPQLPVVLELGPCEEGLMVSCDISRLRRVWHNIVRNVFDQTVGKNPGSVRLVLSAQRVGRNARVRFLDNGGGIARNHLLRVFDPFYTTKGSGNRGLGLFMARKIVVEHGGKIRIMSKRPYTRVTIDLPLIT